MTCRARVPGMIAAVAVLIAVPANAEQWNSIPADSSLEFIVTFEGAESAGRFDSFAAEVEFDAEKGKPSALRVTVDVRSATLSSVELDEAIAEEAWFNSTAYPEANFTSKAIHQTGEQQFLAQGVVSIKGTKQELDLPLHVSIQGNIVELTGTVILSRADFGIGSGEWQSDSSISHRVGVRFRVFMQRAE